MLNLKAPKSIDTVIPTLFSIIIHESRPPNFQCLTQPQPHPPINKHALKLQCYFQKYCSYVETQVVLMMNDDDVTTQVYCRLVVIDVHITGTKLIICCLNTRLLYSVSRQSVVCAWLRCAALPTLGPSCRRTGCRFQLAELRATSAKTNLNEQAQQGVYIVRSNWDSPYPVHQPSGHVRLF